MNEERSCAKKATNYVLGGGSLAIFGTLFGLLTSDLATNASDVNLFPVILDVVLGAAAVAGGALVVLEASRTRACSNFWKSSTARADATATEISPLQTHDELAKAML